MTQKGKAAGALVTPTTAHKNHDCTDHFTHHAANERILVPIQGSRRCFIARRIEICIAALRVRGYQVAQNDDGSYHAVHQHHTLHLSDFHALVTFTHGLGAHPYGDGRAS